MWNYEKDAMEYVFEGQHIHAVYSEVEDNKVELSIFAIKDGKILGHAEDVTIDRDVAEFIVCDIENNHEDYGLQGYYGADGNEYLCLVHCLDKMPFDKGGVHATGYEYLETNGDWVIEYDDEFPEDGTQIQF